MDAKIFEDFEIQEGKVKVMLSAPHCFVHMRDGNIKYAETNTDKIARELADDLKCFSIYKTYSSDNDANWDKESYYRDECLKQVKRSKIKLLIDIHGMASEREEDICIGTNNGELINGDTELENKIIESFKEKGFNFVSINKPFNCGRPECVANFIHTKAGITTFQVEINGKYRFEDSPNCRIKEIKEALLEIIEYFLKNEKK